MIYGNIEGLKEFSFLEEELLECFKYAGSHDLVQYEKGSYPIHGDDLFLNIVEVETMAAEERIWEAHRAYLDLHLMLHGAEQIDLNFTDHMRLEEFRKEEDLVILQGDKKGCVVLEDGDFLVCYPQDAHRAAVAATVPETIKKAVFKIRIKESEE